MNILSMVSEETRVRIQKACPENSSSEKKTETDSNGLPKKTTEPDLKLVEVEPGICEILFTCSCGEKTVIRCASVPQAEDSKEKNTTTPEQEEKPTPNA